MSTPKVKPTEFPVTLNGQVVFVKRADYAKQVSANAAIEFKAEISKSHVVAMLEAIDNGKGLTGEPPEEFVKLFERVKEDYETAVQKVKDDEDEAARKKQEEDDAKKEKEKQEIALFESNKENVSAFSELAKSFDTGSMDRFIPKKGVSDEQLLGAFNASLKMGEFNNWMKGDLIVELEKRGQIGVITRMAEAQGMKFPSLYRIATTCKNIPPDKRRKGVSFTIYSELANAKLTSKSGADGEKEHAENFDRLLEKANTLDEKGGSVLTSQTAREEVKKAQGKSTTPPPAKLPEEDDKRQFIVVDPTAETPNEATLVTGFPKVAHEAGLIVIDLKTGTVFGGFRKAAENRWTALPAYKAPEEKKTEPKAAKKKK